MRQIIKSLHSLFASFPNTTCLVPKSATLCVSGIGDNKIKYFEWIPDGYDTKVRFFDLPGCGTAAFKFDNYIRDQGLRHFDMCILITSTRFTEHDDELAYQLNNFNVPVYLIRSKFDVDLQNHCRDENIEYAKLDNGEQQKIREDMKQELKRNITIALPKSRSVISSKFYILSSHCMPLTIEDWKRLQYDIITELMDHRKADKGLKTEALRMWEKVTTLYAKAMHMFNRNTEELRHSYRETDDIEMDIDFNEATTDGQKTCDAKEHSDVSNLLKQAGLTEYLEEFIAAGIHDKEDLLVLGDRDLKEIGIKLAHRKEIMNNLNVSWKIRTGILKK